MKSLKRNHFINKPYFSDTGFQEEKYTEFEKKERDRNQGPELNPRVSEEDTRACNGSHSSMSV